MYLLITLLSGLFIHKYIYWFTYSLTISVAMLNRLRERVYVRIHTVGPRDIHSPPIVNKCVSACNFAVHVMRVVDESL